MDITKTQKANKLLVVDNELANLQLLITCLGEHYEIQVAHDGEEALTEVHASKPDIILMDVKMPKLDGFETCRRLKADEQTKNIPVVFLTALDDTEDEIKGFEAGAADYLTKPVHYKEMLRRIDTARQASHIKRPVAEHTQELKESEAHLIQSEKMASIGQIMAGVVHEINTPLGYARSSVELTGSYFSDIAKTLEACKKLGKQFQSKDKSDEEQLETTLATAMKLLNSLQEDETVVEAQILLENALSGIDRISSLVKNLKNFSQLNRDKIAEFDVNQGLDEALTMVDHKLCDKIQIIKHYGDVPHIICSPAQINQVFLHLLINAIQAISSDTGVIELQTQVIDQYVYISITDNGDGISKENLARIFEPFFTTKTSGKGTGLGLAIVHKIIKEHQGELNVASQIGRGTQFIIFLPFKQ